MKKHLLVIDGNNLAHRAYHKFKGFTKDGEPSGLIYGFIRILQTYLIRFNPTTCVVCFDSHKSKKSNFRINILEEYKLHREHKKNLDFDPDSFYTQIRVVRKILPHLKIVVIYDSRGLGFEADDYIGYMAKVYQGRVTIVSSDKDFCQLLVKQRVRILNPFKDILIVKKNCEKIMGYKADQTVDYLSLVGDSSDDIPGYQGIGQVNAMKFLNEFHSIRNFLKNKHAEFKKIDRYSLKVVFNRNRKLIDLNYSFKHMKKRLDDRLPIRYPKKNAPYWKHFIEKYGLQSFQRESFIEPFEKLKTLKLKNPIKKLRKSHYEKKNNDYWPFISRENNIS